MPSSPRSSGGWSPTHTQAKRPTASKRTPGPGADVNGSIEPSWGFDQTRLGSVRPPTPPFTPTPSPRPKALEELTAGATGDAVPGAHRRALRPADHGRARERQSAVRTALGPGRSVPGSTPWRRGRSLDAAGHAEQSRFRRPPLTLGQLPTDKPGHAPMGQRNRVSRRKEGRHCGVQNRGLA